MSQIVQVHECACCHRLRGDISECEHCGQQTCVECWEKHVYGAEDRHAPAPWIQDAIDRAQRQRKGD